jgi:sporulation protein YlmC with PRC-barrel domain
MENQHHELILRCSKLTGWTIKNPAAEKVGTVKDIVLNTATGEVAYVVISVDTGFLNLESKYFAVPWQVLKFDTSQDEVVIFDVDKERLENSPGFDKDNWPSGPQMEFITQMNQYYGIEHHQHYDTRR